MFRYLFIPHFMYPHSSPLRSDIGIYYMNSGR